jgi:leader peptidase (prepilin peptidase)/N-methyltransferase
MQPVDLIFLGLLLLCLLPIAAIDLSSRRIPNLLNLALAGLGLARTAVETQSLQTVLIALAQGALTLLVLLGMTWLIQRFRSGGKIGGGDLKFVVAASFWVGLLGSFLVLAFASLLAVAFALITAVFTRDIGWRRLRPFGPMLVLSLMILAACSFAARQA